MPGKRAIRQVVVINASAVALVVVTTGCADLSANGAPSLPSPIVSSELTLAPTTGPTAESDASIRVNQVVDRVHALVGDRNPGKVNYILDASKNRVAIYWKAGVPQPFATILPDLRRTVDVVVIDSPYSRLELTREIRRLLGVLDSTGKLDAVGTSYMRNDGTAIVLALKDTYEFVYPTLRSLGLSSKYPVIVEHTDTYPVPA